MKAFLQFFEDAVPVNVVGSGNVAGCGVGKDGEPGVNKKNKTNVILINMIKRKFKGVTPLPK